MKTLRKVYSLVAISGLLFIGFTPVGLLPESGTLLGIFFLSWLMAFITTILSALDYFLIISFSERQERISNFLNSFGLVYLILLIYWSVSYFLNWEVSGHLADYLIAGIISFFLIARAFWNGGIEDIREELELGIGGNP